MDSIAITQKLNIVCGGGVAGVSAAITAANAGHSVLIIEKSNILLLFSIALLVNLSWSMP